MELHRRIRLFHILCVITMVLLCLYYTQHFTHTIEGKHSKIHESMNIEIHISDATSSAGTDAEVLPPCGEICSYKARMLEHDKSEFYPRLHKQVDCDIVMQRMAYSDHEVVYPPPSMPPDALLEQFTMSGDMPIKRFEYVVTETDKELYFTQDDVNDFLTKIRKGKCVNLYKDRFCVQNLLGNYTDMIRNKGCVVIGTENPWLESILLAHGADTVTTLEYANVTYDTPQLTAYTPYHYAKMYLRRETKPFQFGASFSSIEHSGLGRYTDPLNPYGDLEAMAQAWCMLEPGGVFALGVPSSPEDDGNYIIWNAHRVYGTKRLQHLTANWDVLDMVTCSEPFNHKFIILQKPF